MSRRFGRFASAVLPVCCILTTCGCDRRESDPAAAWSGKLTSPQAVFVQLREWHLKHSYTHMEPWIHPGTRDEIIELLIAVDELMAANQTAQEALLKHQPNVDPRGVDVFPLRNYLDMFSDDAKFISEQINDDKAVVTFQVGKRLPLKHANFGLHQGRWVYMPGEVNSELTPLIRTLAKRLIRFATVVSTSSLTPEQLDSEFTYRVKPAFNAIFRSLSPATAPASGPAAPASSPQ